MRIGPLGIWEILLILVVVLLIFGPRRLPEMAKGIGQSVREFRKGIRDIRDDISKDDEPEPKKVAVVETPAAPSVRVSPIEATSEPSVHVSPIEASAEKEVKSA
jgi:sec-independent protein translocase protein TatA